MTTNHIDHYFPQWLMKNWCDDQNKIWCFDKIDLKVQKIGIKKLGSRLNLYKSSITDRDLEIELFNDIDGFHSTYLYGLILYCQNLYQDNKRIPNKVFDFFIDLFMWTLYRNPIVADAFANVASGWDVEYPVTCDEVGKEAHLIFLENLAEQSETLIQEFRDNFYYSLVVSKNWDNYFITSDIPVQIMDISDADFKIEGYKTWDEPVILFPLYPNVMFVATAYVGMEKFHRHVLDEDLNDFWATINYAGHINSCSRQVFFPYKVYDPNSILKEKLPNALEFVVQNKLKNVPCAIDLEVSRILERPSIIYSNWSGKIDFD
jgi:hypothetical protein